LAPQAAGHGQSQGRIRLVICAQQRDPAAENAAFSINLICGKSCTTPYVATIGALITTEGGLKTDQQWPGAIAWPSLPFECKDRRGGEGRRGNESTPLMKSTLSSIPAHSEVPAT
jgi:hypothetical protein